MLGLGDFHTNREGNLFMCAKSMCFCSKNTVLSPFVMSKNFPMVRTKGAGPLSLPITVSLTAKRPFFDNFSNCVLWINEWSGKSTEKVLNLWMHASSHLILKVKIQTFAIFKWTIVNQKTSSFHTSHLNMNFLILLQNWSWRQARVTSVELDTCSH